MAPFTRNAGFLFLVLSVLVFAVGTTPAGAGETVRINGSGATLDIVQPLIKEYRKLHPGVKFVLDKPLGSSGAVKALLAGALDIAVSSKPLKPEEVAKGAQIREYGKIPLAVVTAGDVGKKDITTRELEDIYAGKTTRWPNGETIRIVLRPREDIDTKILASLSPRLASAIHEAHKRPGMMLAVTDPEATEAIAKTPGGIGTSASTGLLSHNKGVRILSLNGREPTARGVAGGSYPMAKEMRFVTTRGISPAALDFIRFAFSPKGRAIARDEGVFVTAPVQEQP